MSSASSPEEKFGRVVERPRSLEGNVNILRELGNALLRRER